MRVSGNLWSITRLKDGGFRVHVTLDDDGVEEESYRDYPSLKELPRCLFSIQDGKLKYNRGMEITVYMWYRDVHGIAWTDIEAA